MFNSFRSFIPKISTLFVLILLFWGGWFLSFILLVGIGLVIPTLTQHQSLMLAILYILSFGLPMLYSYIRSRKLLKDPECRIIPVNSPDYGKYGISVWWVGSITVGCLLIILALWLTSFIPVKDTMGSYSTLVDNLQLSTLDMILSELVLAPIFSTWFLCVVCVRGLMGNGFSFPLSIVAALIALFLINLDYSAMIIVIAEVTVVGYIYYKTHSLNLSFVTMFVMCGFECLNGITHFFY